MYRCRSLWRLTILPSDTYFKKGVIIKVFIVKMQRNFVLTDLMKTGKHQEIEQFISSHTLKDQSFLLESQYYRLHNYDLDSYDRRFVIVDVRHDNNRLKDNHEFNTEFARRCKLLHSQGFIFISATPWESADNISKFMLLPTLGLGMLPLIRHERQRTSKNFIACLQVKLHCQSLFF